MTKIASAPPGHVPVPVQPSYMVAHCAARRENENIDADDKQYRSCDDGNRRCCLPMPDNADPKRPNFDERLEALKQTLELVAAMHIDNDKEFRERFAEIATTLQQVAANQERDGEHILALVRIAELHDRRLTRLEDEQQ